MTEFDPNSIPERLDCGWMNVQLTPSLAERWLQFGEPPYDKDYPWYTIGNFGRYVDIIRRGAWEFREPPDTTIGYEFGSERFKPLVFFNGGFLLGLTRAAAVVAAEKEITSRVEWGFDLEQNRLVVDGSMDTPERRSERMRVRREQAFRARINSTPVYRAPGLAAPGSAQSPTGHWDPRFRGIQRFPLTVPDPNRTQPYEGPAYGRLITEEKRSTEVVPDQFGRPIVEIKAPPGRG